MSERKWYTIATNHGKSEHRPAWQHRRFGIYGPKTQASIEWNAFGKHGFGLGFQLGINGSESDIGLDLYLGRLLSFWLRLRSPWTRWMRLDSERFGYHVRHWGVRLFMFKGRWLTITCGAKDGYWSRDDPWWYEVKFGTTQLWGRTRSTVELLDSGVARVPMPEGNYMATWKRQRHAVRHVRFPGTLRDRLVPRIWEDVSLDIPGCIPVQGKGENSWDVGMDGVCGTGGKTLEDAVGNATKAALRDRQRYGGPHDLDRPMTISEAESR